MRTLGSSLVSPSVLHMTKQVTLRVCDRRFPQCRPIPEKRWLQDAGPNARPAARVKRETPALQYLVTDAVQATAKIWQWEVLRRKLCQSISVCVSRWVADSISASSNRDNRSIHRAVGDVTTVPRRRANNRGGQCKHGESSSRLE